MDNLLFKKVNSTDKSQVFNLVDTVIEKLEKKEFFVPYSDEEKRRFFDDNYAPLYGAYDNNKLIAMSQLFLTDEIIEEYYDILSIQKSKSICELGGFLVFPEYWNKGIMTKLSEIQYNLANMLNLDYIISTAHPDNIASNRILQKLNLELFDTITTSGGYLRNLYYKKLK